MRAAANAHQNLCRLYPAGKTLQVARRGSCVHTFEMKVTEDIGLWQFRRRRRIAWCRMFPKDQHHAHLITSHRYQIGENKIMFYDKNDHRAFRVAPFDAWDYNAEELEELAKV